LFAPRRCSIGAGQWTGFGGEVDQYLEAANPGAGGSRVR